MRLLPCAYLIVAAAIPAPVTGQSLHTFGDPTAHEQAYIELINRARANPAAEGVLLSTTTHPDILAAISWAGVNLTQFQTEMNAIPVRPPLAPHAGLTTAARGHSQWLFDNARQEHNQTGGQTFLQRMSAVGYSGTTGENIYSYAEDALHGHAGFEIDWADPDDPYATFGMQNPRGHRDNIHSGTFREIGVGVVNGTKTYNGNTVGPQVVTQDFGVRSSSPYYGTGVAYYDLNGNNFYDVGEGISGLTVNVSGASHYCISAIGGGWTVPIPSTAATRTVSFTGLGMNQSRHLNVPANSNAKTDLRLTYTPPAFASSPIANKNQSHSFQFSTVPGATGYNFTSYPLTIAAAENCENLTNATAATSPGYSVVQSAIKHEGSAAWRMAFVNVPPASNQNIQLNGLYLGTGTSSISFRSRLGLATTVNSAKVQVREEGTPNWVDIYSQQGTNTWGESTFHLRTASLASMAGKRFRIRFAFQINGSYYNNTNVGAGWYLDAIHLSHVYGLGTPTTGVFNTPHPTLTAPSGSGWHIHIQPVISGNLFPGSSQTLRLLEPNQGLDLNKFGDWALHREAWGQLWPGSLSASSDPDGDGRETALEFVFGSNPAVSDPAPSGFPGIHPSPTHLVVRYQVNTALVGIEVGPQVWTGGGTWFSPGQSGAPPGFTDSLVSTNGSIQIREAKVPISSGPKNFIRLRASLP